MISVLICSARPDLLQQVSDNVKSTIGIEHEIIYQDNREIDEGICKVYNKLAEKARFDHLCFLHEDVLLQTKEWGKKIVEILSTVDNIGLVGIAGCKYKSSYFSGWFSNTKELDCANYIHQYQNHSEKVYLSPDESKKLHEVVCIDGVFMCCTKKAWELYKFNESQLTGFHFYDIDFSLSVAHIYKVMVTYDIDLTHITTGGDYGNKWVTTAIDYHTKINRSLPYSKTTVNKKVADRNTIVANLDFLKNYNISASNKMKWIFLQRLHHFPKYYYAILKFVFYKPLKLRMIHKLLSQK